MEAMGLIAIIVNCYLIGQCGQLQRLFPWLSPEMAIISIVILEVPQSALLVCLTSVRLVLFQTCFVIQHKIYGDQKMCKVFRPQTRLLLFVCFEL